MSEAQTAGGLDRLPWLADEPAPRPPAPVERRSRDLTGWAALAVALVAGVSFWLGSRSQPADTGHETSVRPSATIPRQRPAQPSEVRIAPQPQVAPVPVPEVRPAPAPQVRIAAPTIRKAVRQAVRHAEPPPRVSETRTPPAPRPAAAPVAKPAPAAVLRPWPSRVTAGAYGRLVQIGAYGSRLQAKQGWVKMVRSYPAVAHLSAVVVETRNSRGRPFYRFQIGTTSQAHSEVLCQRMERIRLSCAVVGLPWKAKVER